MRFTTLYFLFFFALVYVVFWIIPRRFRPHLIFVASLGFYAAWSWQFAVHLLLVLLVNYLALIRLLGRPRRSTLALIVVLNVVNLVFFKYFYFILGTASQAVGVIGPERLDAWLEHNLGVSHIVLPLAISFYTFQLIALQVDAYRGKIPERPSIIEYLMFSLYFPHFVAGPIMRHSDFFYQLRNLKPDETRMLDGLLLVGAGLVKKVVIADNVDFVLKPVFANPGGYDWSTNLMAALGFAARIYCDFSGYTDIARGSSKMLGLDIPENFKAPFLSASVGEFWNRWHVTLMMWLRDYVYIPLGGSRRSPARNYANLILTMALSGLWHGASFTFLLWGLWNGVFVSIEKLLGVRTEFEPGFIRDGFVSSVARLAFRFGGMVYAYLVFALGLILFNSQSLQSAMNMYGQIFFLRSGAEWPHTEYVFNIVAITLLFNIVQSRKQFHIPVGWKSYPVLGALGLVVLLLLGSFPPGTTDFIYFQF